MMHGMKFTVQRDALAEAVAWAARALPARPVIPVLAGLMLQASGDRLTLACFDYEVSARVAIPADVAEPGTALVPGRLLAEITRALPGQPVEVADEEDGLALECGEALFTLVTLPQEDYPSLPERLRLAGTADGGALATAIAQVTPAASKDDTLPLLTAVHLELAGETMTLAATDRYRLAARDLPWSPAGRPAVTSSDGSAATPGGGRGGGGALLVPARTLAEAGRMMGAGRQVRILLSVDGPDAVIGFEVGERRLTTRLLAGEFPKFGSRFAAEFGCVADLPAEGLAEAVRRVSLVAERGTPVRLSFADGRVTVTAGTAGHARARESVPAQFSGNEPAIAFSPQFLLDGVIAAMAGITADGQAGVNGAARRDGVSEANGEDGDAPDAAGSQGWPPRVRISFNSPAKPAVITAAPCPGAAGTPAAAAAEAGQPGAGFRYLVVPQRVTDGWAA